MAKFRLDLRKTLRAIATSVQESNVARLLASQGVDGSGLEPHASPRSAKTSKKRVRLFGVRHSLADLGNKVGIATGALLKDMARRGNQKIGRVGFKIRPSSEQWAKFFVFNSGDKRQRARPVSGMTGAQLDEATSTLLEESRAQFVASVKDRGE